MKNKSKKFIKVWETECRLCKKKIRGDTKKGVTTKLGVHIDNDCGVAKALRLMKNMTPKEIEVMNKVMK